MAQEDAALERAAQEPVGRDALDYLQGESAQMILGSSEAQWREELKSVYRSPAARAQELEWRMMTLRETLVATFLERDRSEDPDEGFLVLPDGIDTALARRSTSETPRGRGGGARSLILIPILGSWAWGGLAADVPAHAESAQRQRRDPAAAESSSPGPAGRGRLPLPAEIALPEPPQGVETASSDAKALPSHQVRRTAFRGRELSYVVIDGMAVHAGDMVLGRVEDLEPPPSLTESRRSADREFLRRRDLSPRSQKYVWPEGIVPYVLDSDVAAEQRQNIAVAIGAWNDKTVISLVARSTESNYVRFSNVASGNCRADIGMVGGEQEISLPPDGCSANTVVHEIGHAVGLWHEHQREDRDLYVTVLYENLDMSRQHRYSAKHPALGPYDYASTMHYSPRGGAWNGRGVFETVPPGMDIPSAGLSAGDIDGVARLYGKPLEATSITTNPPGMEIVVDGIRVTAPASFEWPDGSAHIVEAPVSQTIEGSRYLFGRWNDGGSRLRNVAAGAGSTWLEANFIVQHRVGTRAEPTDAGTVDLRPESPDGFYTVGTPIQAVATPAPSAARSFLRWAGTIRGQHGRSANPATWTVDRPGKEFAAVFTDGHVFRITANVDPFVLHIRNYYDNVDEDWTYAPANLLTNVARTTIGLRIDEVRRAPRNRLRHYRFEHWSNGGARSQTLSLPPGGGSISARITSEYPLSTDVANAAAGTITVNPASSDGFYPEDASVHLAAAPNPGWEFVQWRGSIESRESGTTVAMNRPMHVEAVFSQISEVRPGRPVRVSLPATKYRFFVHDRESGFRIEPPSDASEIRISYEASTPGVEVDLFVRAGSERLLWNYGEDGRTPEFRADYQSTLRGSTETVVINADSNPPLNPSKTYYASLVVFSPRTRIEGAMSAEIDRGPSLRPSAGASPRALTFVSPLDADPATQIVRLTNKGTSSFHYVVDSAATWLSATPASGTLAGGSTSEIEVGTLTAGVRPDTHSHRLTVMAAAPHSQIMEAVTTIPVTLVVVAAGGNSGDGGVTSPRLLYKVEPEYSETARKARIEGTVFLTVEIWEDGKAHNIRVLRSLGYGLDEQAIKAVKQWRFSPGKKDGKPVRVAAQIQVSFRLVDSPPGVVAAPLQVVVPLGSTGETVLLTQSEDGSWWLGGALVTSGETAVRTENGNVYTLVMTTDAAGAMTWTAVRVRD